jgi:hypothetical protein
MRAFLMSCAAAIVIAIGAAVILNYGVQRPADSAFHSTTGVRLPPADHGT